MLAVAEQRLRLEGLHYSSCWSVWLAAVILGGGWGGNWSLSSLIRSCSTGVAGRDEFASVGGREINVDHLDGGELSRALPAVRPRATAYRRRCNVT